MIKDCAAYMRQLHMRRNGNLTKFVLSVCIRSFSSFPQELMNVHLIHAKMVEIVLTTPVVICAIAQQATMEINVK